LKRLDKSGLIKAFWGEGDSTGGGRRRYYSLTKNGREFLNRNKLDSDHTRALLNKFLAEVDAAEKDPANDEQGFVAFVENVEKEKAYSDAEVGNEAAEAREDDDADAVQTSFFDEGPTKSAEPYSLAVQPTFVEIAKSRAVYELPENFGERPVEIQEENREEVKSEELYVPYAASPRYDFQPFDYDDQQERARIQHEEYNREYERTLAEKEISASKLYDTMYAPSLPYSSVIKNNEILPPLPPPPRSVYNDGDLFATYAPRNAVETDDLSDDEKKDYAAKRLGIGRYRDPSYASRVISENERIQAKNRAKEDLSYPPAVTAADEKPSNISAAVNASGAVGDKIYGETPSNLHAYEDERQTRNDGQDGYNKSGEYDQNIQFLDENELKFHQFEKYDAEDDKDFSGYKSVFKDEILIKRASGNEPYETPTANERTYGDEPSHFHDVKNKLSNEGYEVKAYNKANTSEFYAKNYIFSRKINAHTYLTAWGVWFIEFFMAATIFNSFFHFKPVEFWSFALIPAVVPLFFWAVYGANSGKRKKDDFDVKRAIKTNLITAVVLLVLTSVIALCFLNATVGDGWRVSILTPAILFTNIPLSAVIYDTFRKTRKYNLS
jgi:DNA-binding PadR family transcriptional regulator